ncbi:DUF4136 domain-containing protein [Nitrospira sp. MA-1]|nr:DUF4136 domain-containing protein [Nitrospira sp. MA-1]
MNIVKERVFFMRCFMGLFVLLSLPVSFGCSSISVSSDYRESTDFSKLKTFSWMLKTPEGEIDLGGANQMARQRIESAIAAELANKGYIEIVAGNSDFHVTYYVGREERIQVQSMGGPLMRPYWGMGMGYTEVYQYEEGTLIIDLLDAKAPQHIIWRGVAKGVVDWKGTTGGQTGLINEAVQKVLAQFPPKPS